MSDDIFTGLKGNHPFADTRADGAAALPMWTVYDHPSDYPDEFVARRYEVDRAGARPTSKVIVSVRLDGLRLKLSRMGLTCIGREPDDDPKILETWL